MITKNIIMGQLIKQEPKAYEILTGFGMHSWDVRLLRWKVWKMPAWSTELT